MLNKDTALNFLETVSYDEVMAYDYMLNSQNEEYRRINPEWAEMRDTILEIGKETYNWDEERLMSLGRLINFHCVEVPCEDWRFNYFWVLTKNLPESILEEQFPTLKKLGDEMTQLKRNALTYQNRMLEILMIHDSVTGMYPLIHLEDDNLELPPLTWMGKTIAWKNTQSRTMSFIMKTLGMHLAKTPVYSPTPDLKEKFAVTKSGPISIVKIKNQIKIIGMNGAVDLTNIKLSSV